MYLSQSHLKIKMTVFGATVWHHHCYKLTFQKGSFKKILFILLLTEQAFPTTKLPAHLQRYIHYE